jgi:glutaryl-CoA dehydrogenase
MSTTAMPHEHPGHALTTDYFLVRETPRSSGSASWPPAASSTMRCSPTSTTTGSGPRPWPLFRRLAELGLVGEDIEGYGCRP